MLLTAAKWPIWFWDIFSIFSIDPRFNKWQLVYSALLMISCVHNIVYTSETVCAVEGACDSSLSTIVKGLFMRVVAVICLMSRMVIFFKDRNHLILYAKHLEKYHVLAQTTSSETETLKIMSYRLVVCCVLLTVPANVVRLEQILAFKSAHVMVSFVLMYLQNFCVYCVETHFVVLCYILHQKLVGINRDLMALNIDTQQRNNYPFTLKTGKRYGENTSFDYNTEVLRSLADGRPMTDLLEQLKFKHKLVREAVDNLNDMFGIQLGLSVCSLCLFAIFDLYFYMVSLNSDKYAVLIYVWILQYAVRFGTVTILGNLTIQQVIKSKILLMDINNRFLDNNTKEELQLFYDQLCSGAIEFTACNFFTINNHLITSAITAGTTYLMICLKFK